MTLNQLKERAAELGLTADDVRAYGKLSAKQTWIDAIAAAETLEPVIAQTVEDANLSRSERIRSYLTITEVDRSAINPELVSRVEAATPYLLKTGQWTLDELKAAAKVADDLANWDESTRVSLISAINRAGKNQGLGYKELKAAPQETLPVSAQEEDSMHQAMVELKAQRESYKEWEDAALAYMNENRTIAELSDSETLNAQTAPEQPTIYSSPAFPILLLLVCLLLMSTQINKALVQPTVAYTKKRCTAAWKELQGMQSPFKLVSIV